MIGSIVIFLLFVLVLQYAMVFTDFMMGTVYKKKINLFENLIPFWLPLKISFKIFLDWFKEISRNFNRLE